MTKRRTRQAHNEARQKRNEVCGVILIALGAFLSVCVYFEAIGIVGEAVTATLFGLTGLFAYALPLVLAGVGIWVIASAADSLSARAPLLALGALFIAALIHVAARRAITDITFFAYMKDAYLYGADMFSGGGAAGALLCYPLVLLTGEPGAYIFLIAGILIVVLLISRLSLRETGQRVTTRVKAGIQHAGERRAARKSLYMEALSDSGRADVNAARKIGRKDSLEEDLTFLPTAGPIQRGERSMRDFGTAEAGAVEASPAGTPSAAEKADAPPWADTPDTESAPVDSAADGIPITYYDENEPARTVGDLKREAEPDDFAATPLRTPLRIIKAPAEDTAEEAAPPFEADAAQRPPYVKPSFSLLDPPRASYGRASIEAPQEKAKLLIKTLESFHVQARVVDISVGPVVTRFELAPAPGVRVNKITALSDDIALALAAPRVRIEAPIPGKSAVGIEVPNKDTAMVVLRDIVESREFVNAVSPITLALGKDIAGKIIVSDLAKMPHLLIAGATGSGKSVCINGIIISLIYKCTPDDLQLILVDPKVVELSVFGALPHLKAPVVTDPKKAAGALASGVREMDDRYRKFAKIGARDLARYNDLQKDAKDRLPKLVIIIDELADLMMVAPDTVEDSICRIAQLGRAAGIHLIVATQRPSADVITGLIKANIPSRIAFAVASAIDSRIILDSGGAEKLLGRGDMLFHPNGAGKPLRAQAAYVSDEEVERIARHFQAQMLEPEFDEKLMEEIDTGTQESAHADGRHEDELLGEAVRIVLDSGQASISMIQRRLRVGYARAARLVDIMEQRGYVSGFDGSKPRRLLISRVQYEALFGQEGGACDDE